MTGALGTLSAAAFLRRYWQKEPLVIRQALPGFAGFVERDALFGLARRADAVSRVVLEHPRRRQRWELHTGPFAELRVVSCRHTHWTLLVQGVEGLVDGGVETLLRRFSFIPSARIDDLMISYAAPDGSVGPHIDQYDVFLLQGPGRRRWQIGRPAQPVVDVRAPIKVLKHFAPDDEFVLDAGDLLYLPPGVAHHGVAVDGPCFTYSIGAVAPSHDALLQNFLVYWGQRLEQVIDPEALYADPQLRASAHPQRLGDDVVDETEKLLRASAWRRGDIEDYLGRLLTGPKPHIVFAPPARPLAPHKWRKQLATQRVRLALPTRGLRRGRHIFINGRRAWPVE